MSVGSSHIDIEAHVRFIFDVRLQVGHLEVVVHKVHNEVREPRVLTACLEKLIEQFLTLLPKVVAKYLETHQSLVLSE